MTSASTSFPIEFQFALRSRHMENWALVLIPFLTAISALMTVVSIGYCIFCIFAALRFTSDQRRSDASIDLPPVSILKPLKGADPNLYEALRSHCVQDYAEFEILLGISDNEDSAMSVAENLRNEFPDRVRLVQCEKRLCANGKVSSLEQLLPVASHEILVVDDSDIRVEPNYLRTIVSELQQPTIGMVTCLYRGIPGASLWSKLETLGISTDFAPGVLAARLIERGLHFGLGSTLAFRKTDLKSIGGFEAIGDYLADDYELGRRIDRLGYKIALSEYVVETHLPAYNFSGFFSHQLRWARTIRVSRPLGYIGLLLTFTLPWSLSVVLLSSGALWSWCLLVVGFAARLGLAIAIAKRVLHDPGTLRSLWLLPLRDLFGVITWVAGLTGRRIVWRGESFRLEKGKLIPAD